MTRVHLVQHRLSVSWHVSMRPVRPVVNFFYDMRISRPLLFDQDLVVNFATYMREYTVTIAFFNRYQLFMLVVFRSNLMIEDI